VARVSFWHYSEDRAAILCQDLFEAATQRHSSGQELRARDFPAYFQALATSEIIAAEDARRDPRTREFTATYLEPLGIAAMLDAPVQVAGKLAGVLCLEHIGTPRAWTPGERSLAVAAGSLLALALAQSALARSEERFRELAENIGDIFYNYDPASQRLLYVNRAYERILGRSIEHAYACPTGYLEDIHPDDRPAVERAFERELAGELTRVEFRILRPDGGVRWIREEAVPVLDAQNRVKRIVGTMRDITDAKQGEQALRDSEERYALAVRASQAALWDWNMSTDVIVYSPRYREMLGGYTREEFPDTLSAFFSKVHPDDLEAVKQAIKGHVERSLPTPDAVEFRLLTKRGDYRWFRASAQAEWDASGRPLRMVGSTVDIHERRLAEAKVREQAELLDKAQDAILVRDLEHRIQYWNKSAERLYGWTAEEAIGRSVKELLYHDPAMFLAATAATLEKGEWVGEQTQYNQAGQALTVEGRWTLVRDGQAQPKSILAINTDISERKRIEQQLLRTQRMESLGTLAGGIAHDLNNVLAPILVSIEFLRLDERDPERLTVLASLEDSARRGADLVRQVLSFARGIEGERVLTNLHHLARELRQIIRETFPKNLEFRLASAPDLWQVSADPTQMHQVMMNLCVNARDAMPEGGRLTLGLRNFEVDDVFAGMNPDARPGPYVIIKVEDTGTGIPANIQERIFDPFFTTKEFGKGTGLGLATVLTIVKSHGGFIHLHSEPGTGTKFEVYLPAGAASESGERPAAEPARLPRGQGEFVLVVDDEESVRLVTQKTLERFGYRVLLAAHGAEAVALYAEQGAEIAVVLTDMAMPVMDGPATILALKAMNPAVKIIGSSGHASEGGVAKAVGAGVQHFVPKPYTAETLLKVLADVLTRPA
jgi:PAS domain S-box-containing protein